MRRIAWVVLLVACRKEGEPEHRAPIAPPVEDLGQLAPPPPPQIPAAAPRTPPSPVPPVPDDAPLACFSAALRVAVPHTISSVTVGDFDNDRRPDVVVTYETLADSKFTGHVALYRNLGDGRLAAHSQITAGDMVYAVTAGDIDGDGNLDLAVGDPNGKRTLLYAGRGDGTFTPKPAVDAGRKPYGATLADLDGDGKLDLVTELFHDVQLYKGDGKFGFRRTTTIHTRQAPDGPVVGDFNGDHRVDLAYGANDEGTFFTLAGTAAGFRQNLEQPACGDPAYTTGGDFDDDGNLDVGYVCTDVVELRLGDGRGGFRTVTLPIRGANEPIVAGDLTGDGKTDLLVASRNFGGAFDLTSRLTLLANLGNGAWQERASADLPIITGQRAADLDGDERLDLVLATWTGRDAALVVLLGRGCP